MTFLLLLLLLLLLLPLLFLLRPHCSCLLPDDWPGTLLTSFSYASLPPLQPFLLYGVSAVLMLFQPDDNGCGYHLCTA
jgi:hypothetical protein